MFKPKVIGGETCPHCKGAGRSNRWWFGECWVCRGHGREPYVADLRGYTGVDEIAALPQGFTLVYDSFLTDPPDTRSRMIYLLDAQDWRDSLTPVSEPVDNSATISKH